MTSEQWGARFDIRYGPGAYARLCAYLEQPQHTFSHIAAHYGVTRERVRQRHRFLMPDAPAGRARRRLHRRREDWRDLIHDDLFRTFYQHARRHAPGEQVRPIATTHGYSRARALLNQSEVALRRPTPRRVGHRVSYAFRITTPAAPVEYMYVLLPDDTFFLLPCRVLPRSGTAFQNAPTSKYLRFKNTFDALHYVDGDDGPMAGTGEPDPITSHTPAARKES